MNIVFLGTPEIARVCLEKIFYSKHKVLGVVTKLDKMAGRGNHLVPSPVKTFALEHNIPLFQYANISKEGVQDIKKLAPDALVLVAFGQILSEEVLNIALPINLHGSLLPELRGPSPIQTAILQGKKFSGVTVMKMEKGVDSGAMLLQKEVEISETDTSGTLFEKMALVGADALVEALDKLEAGTAVWVEQNHQNATFCEMLTKEKSTINFDDTAQNIVNKIRAYNPNPYARLTINGEVFKILSAKVANISSPQPFGTILNASSKEGLIVSCKDGAVEIVELQAPNSKPMTAKAYLNGKALPVGERI